MSEKTTEELLALLDQEGEAVPLSELELFIRDLNIVEAQTKVPARVIYWEYMKWKENGNGTEEILNRRNFFIQFKKLFKYGKDKVAYYLIDNGSFDMSRWEMEAIMYDLRNERKHYKWLRKKETSQKRRG
jgi:hypothetical protein